MEKSVRAYVDSLEQLCADVLGENLSAVWIVGSLATGDFDIRCSDVDVLVISGISLSSEAKAALGARLSHRSLQCPAHGIDLLVYRVSEVADLPREPRYEFSISSGIDWEDEISSGGPYPGGLIDLAAAYERGVSILGPKPKDMIGKCPDAWIVEELRKCIEWHQTRVHDPFHDPSGANAVLNACRALRFLSHGTFASKSEGARWFLSRRQTGVVSQALRQRQPGMSVDRLDAAEVLDFLGMVAEELENAASSRALPGGATRTQPGPQGQDRGS